MTLTELAEKIEVSRQTNSSVKLALRFAELFGCKVADIFFSDRTRSKRAGDFQEGVGN